MAGLKLGEWTPIHPEISQAGPGWAGSVLCGEGGASTARIWEYVGPTGPGDEKKGREGAFEQVVSNQGVPFGSIH